MHNENTNGSLNPQNSGAESKPANKILQPINGEKINEFEEYSDTNPIQFDRIKGKSKKYQCPFCDIKITKLYNFKVHIRMSNFIHFPKVLLSFQNFFI